MSRPLSQKEAGAYYTPRVVADSLLHWALRSDDDRLLDPACGDGGFIASHRNSVGIEQDARAAQLAIQRAPGALVHEGDFFSWAQNTLERFECAAGNPPFIRYQTFSGRTRDRALSLCSKVGAQFSGLASSWAPFLVATATLLKPGARMAFVVPAEIGHAPYAAPLLEYLIANFGVVHVIAVRSKLFPDLSEDCWLLYADGHGRQTAEIRFTALSEFRLMTAPPSSYARIPVAEWRTTWRSRLRPFLLDNAGRDLYGAIASDERTRRLGQLASVGIGYVSGANDFFHLRPSEARRLKIPPALLHTTVRNGRALPPKRLTAAIVNQWRKDDEEVLLLKIEKTAARLPVAVRRYLDSEAGQTARTAYKCRVREPWYAVPDVQVPNFFLSYMSGLEPSLVRNDAGCTCTNSVHGVRIRPGIDTSSLHNWTSPFTRLSCEIEGHPLGGGMLKLEPREAARIALPPPSLINKVNALVVENALSTMREWRHYARAH